MRFIFTCGGTAGHINPALAVAKKLREIFPCCDILFIGAENMMESKLVPLEGFDIKCIKITNISRSLSPKGIYHNINTVINVAASIKNSKEIIKQFKPDCVIGTGGYVCYPVLSAARHLGIPTLLHESNAFPGLTTKLLSKKVDRILTGFECEFFKDFSNVSVVGTPVRNDFDNFTKKSAKDVINIDKPVVLSVMGSLGAEFMNNVILDMINNYSDIFPFHLIHVSGEKYSDMFSNVSSDNVTVFTYLNDIAKYMIASDLIICRAGASTLSELTYIGKPAIIIPSPNVTNNHQEKNARALENKNAAIVMLENEINSKVLFDKIVQTLSDDNLLDKLSESSKQLSFHDSAKIIAEHIIDLAEGKKNAVK